MILPWRKRKALRGAARDHQEAKNRGLEIVIPNHFRCPISLELMKDPVTLSSGFTYDRESIDKWIVQGNNKTCPITNQLLTSLEPIPNHTIRRMIQDWCVENKSYGIERIPTPRIPVTSVQVSEIVSELTAACTKADHARCVQLVAKIRALAKESERNKRCFVANGTVSALAAALESFSKASLDENVTVLEEILSALTLFPLVEEAKTNLGSDSSLRCIVWFLHGADLSSRRNAVLLLKDFIRSSKDQKIIDHIGEMEGVAEALVKLIREPICSNTTKASLTIIYQLVTSSSSNERMRAKLVETGLVSLIIETLVDAERSICEKALGVLDGICESEIGREEACNHDLTVPVLVKKMLRVSDLATELSVSVLWNLSKNEKREGRDDVLAQAVQVGAFQKTLLLLQVGCGERTKEKATQFLKLLNLRRNGLGCVESTDFKHLKRPF